MVMTSMDPVMTSMDLWLQIVIPSMDPVMAFMDLVSIVMDLVMVRTSMNIWILFP